MPIFLGPTTLNPTLATREILQVNDGDDATCPALRFAISVIMGTESGSRTYGWSFGSAGISFSVVGVSVREAAYYYADGTPDHVNGAPAHVNGTPAHVTSAPEHLPIIP